MNLRNASDKKAFSMPLLAESTLLANIPTITKAMYSPVQ